VATITNLAGRLRSELGDFPKSFVYQTVADGTSQRYLIPYSPLDGLTLSVHVGGVDVSTGVEVEEATGYIIFDNIPTHNASIVVAGNYYRYFTTEEIQNFVTTAFQQHTANHNDAFGRTISLAMLNTLDEYPVIVYASTLALYTLATDASFDIDITAPDGVNIPRSERYRQLMEMVQARKAQYVELCSQLGIGLYKIDVFTLRRTSKTTNQYVPVYMPQEVDDIAIPIRVRLPIPTYGAQPMPTTAITQDLYITAGDDYSIQIQFNFVLDNYTAKSQIRQLPTAGILLANFAVSTPDVGAVDGVGLRTLQLDLTKLQTRSLPGACYYDVQLTDNTTGATHTYVTGKVFVTPEVTV
jgi:hypothetical protein